MESPFESSRLSYRAIEAEDESLLFTWGSDYTSQMNSFHGLTKPTSKASAKSSREWLDKQLLSVVICLRDDTSTFASATSSEPAKTAAEHAKPTPVGFISLRTDESIFAHHRNAEIGISISAAFQGKGYGTEAIEWILEWGFSLAGLHRIGIGCYEWNDGARRLYGRMGFVPESRTRKAFWYKGAWWDGIGFGMLEDEWKERQARAKEGKVGAE